LFDGSGLFLVAQGNRMKKLTTGLVHPLFPARQMPQILRADYIFIPPPDSIEFAAGNAVYPKVTSGLPMRLELGQNSLGQL
jgi:hypothetical protein